MTKWMNNERASKGGRKSTGFIKTVNMALIKSSVVEFQIIKSGSIEVVQSTFSLPQYRDKINSVDKENSFTFMHYAAMYDRPDVIACLVGLGAGKLYFCVHRTS